MTYTPLPILIGYLLFQFQSPKTRLSAIISDQLGRPQMSVVSQLELSYYGLAKEKKIIIKKTS